jgi:hypothetical protein
VYNVQDLLPLFRTKLALLLLLLVIVWLTTSLASLSSLDNEVSMTSSSSRFSHASILGSLFVCCSWCAASILYWNEMKKRQHRFTSVKVTRVNVRFGLYIMMTTLPSQWFPTPAILYAYQPLLQIAQIPDVSSMEGAVIGTVPSTRKFHHWHQTHE